MSVLRSGEFKQTLPQEDVPLLKIALQPGCGANRQRQRKQRGVLILTLVISDALIVSLALLLAWYLRIGSGLLTYTSPSDIFLYRQAIFISVFVFLAIFFISGLYDYNLLLGGPREYGFIVQSCTYGMIALVLVSFMQHDQPLSRGWLLMSWALCILFMGMSRFCWRRVFQHLRKSHEWFITPTLIVGVNEHAKAIARQLTSQSAGVRILGFLDEYLPQGTHIMEGLSVLGTPVQIHKLCLQYDIEQIIFLPNAVTWETFQEIIQQSGYENGYETLMSPGFFEILAANFQVTHIAFIPLLRLGQARITGIDRFLKSALDYGVGILLIPIALPVIGMISLAIYLTDGRPVFTRYKVLGLGGKPFQTIKFRTDLLVATNRPLNQTTTEIVDNHQFSSRFGRFLYRTGLNTLPQLFDVLRGRMSLVGPRASSYNPLQLEKSHHPSLLTVKPGWTGPRAMGGVLIDEDETNLNLIYIRNWTIWLDIQILFRSFKKVLSGRNYK